MTNTARKIDITAYIDRRDSSAARLASEQKLQNVADGIGLAPQQHSTYEFDTAKEFVPVGYVQNAFGVPTSYIMMRANTKGNAMPMSAGEFDEKVSEGRVQFFETCDDGQVDFVLSREEIYHYNKLLDARGIGSNVRRSDYSDYLKYGMVFNAKDIDKMYGVYQKVVDGRQSITDMRFAASVMNVYRRNRRYIAQVYILGPCQFHDIQLETMHRCGIDAERICPNLLFAEIDLTRVGIHGMPYKFYLSMNKNRTRRYGIPHTPTIIADGLEEDTAAARRALKKFCKLCKKI